MAYKDRDIYFVELQVNAEGSTVIANMECSPEISLFSELVGKSLRKCDSSLSMGSCYA